MSNHIHYNVRDEIIYSLPNINGCTVEVCEWISNFILHFTAFIVTGNYSSESQVYVETKLGGVLVQIGVYLTKYDSLVVGI